MTDRELFERACAAMQHAYAPYSGFRVGACLLSADGRAFAGANFENSSYGATICAERAAASRAVSEGARIFEAIAVAAEKDMPWPCGICRQVLYELSAGEGEMRVIVGVVGGEMHIMRLADLLPHGFRLATPGAGRDPGAASTETARGRA